MVIADNVTPSNKHIDFRAHTVEKLIRDDVIKLERVPSNLNKACLLIKSVNKHALSRMILSLYVDNYETSQYVHL